MMELPLPTCAWGMACVIRLTPQPGSAWHANHPCWKPRITILSHFRHINVFPRMHKFSFNDRLQTQINNGSEVDRSAQLIKPQTLQWMATPLLFQWKLSARICDVQEQIELIRFLLRPTEAALKLSYSCVNSDRREMNSERQCSENRSCWIFKLV